ncbi:MAG: DUF3794 domain-containing protein [Roseburia sp.]|nr:DUF3794 domain-containing protein [Roseburia sp.]
MPENIRIKSDEYKPIARGQAVVEARQAADGYVRVLSVSAAASVRPSEIFAGEARYTGKVRFDCLVSDGTRVECVSTIAEFSDKISSPEITAGMAVALVPEIVNCEATVEGGAIKMTAVVDTVGFAAVHCACDCMTLPDDGVYVEKTTVEYGEVCAQATEIAYINDSIGGVKATEALCVSSRAIVTSAECSDGAVQVSGTVYSDVIVRTADDLIASYRLTTPFIKSVAAQGAEEGCVAFAGACVTDSAVALETGEENTLELAVTMILDVAVIKKAQAEAFTDVFCADSEIEVETVEATLCTVEPQTTVTDTVDGQIALEPDRLAADNVLCVTNTFCTVADARTDGGRVYAEGLVGGDIVYYNAEKNAVDSVAFRLPFSMPLSVHSDAQNVTATAVVTDVSVRVRRESVFDIKAEVAFTLCLSSCRTVTLVGSVEIGEPIPRPNATVIVHIAKPGETLWQAAKALCCSPERVTEQNSATAPFEGGERLISFCNK